MKNSPIVKRLVSSDGETKKFLFKLDDGQTIESVLMKCKHGHTICISSQVGCKMGCAFCVTGKGGFARDLTPEEMILQIEEVQKSENVKITCVVLMGMGEPLDNYENVLEFLKYAIDKNGLNMEAKRITISTCGLVDKIYELSEINSEINLAVSLHATNDEVRSQLMKINKKWNISELLTACKVYNKNTKKSILFEYIMINDINDYEDDAKRLSKLLKDLNCKVDLIPANDSENERFKPSSSEQINKFVNILKINDINVSVRGTVGGDIKAACGQLRAEKL